LGLEILYHRLSMVDYLWVSHIVYEGLRATLGIPPVISVNVRKSYPFKLQLESIKFETINFEVMFWNIIRCIIDENLVFLSSYKENLNVTSEYVTCYVVFKWGINIFKRTEAWTCLLSTPTER
jgi:hypothetical protein